MVGKESLDSGNVCAQPSVGNGFNPRRNNCLCFVGRRKIVVALILVVVLGVMIAISCVLLNTSSGSSTNNSHGSPTNRKQPHIVLVLADDLGWHDVSYHNSRIQTPTIDSLSANGVRLENYYVQPMCSPTRCQLMSGRYNIHNGRQHNLFLKDQPTGLPLDSPTMADKLREAGYATHQIGKWHLGFYKEEYMPNSRGFDTSFGFLTGYEDHYTHESYHPDYGSHLDLRMNGAPVFDKSGEHSNYMFTQHAEDVIYAHDKDKPLFIYLSYPAPHSPLQVPRSYEELYLDITDNDRRPYAGLVTMLDEGIANITNALKNTGLWDDTVFVFFSDNGGQVREGHGGSNYPLRGWKFSLWEGGMRSVGFVSGGNNIDIARGNVNTELIHVSDWFPTFVRLAGGSLNGTKPLDGVDQWETISQGKPTQRKWLLHNIDELTELRGKRRFNDTFDTRVRAALRRGDIKIITGYPNPGSWVPPPEINSLTRLDPSEYEQTEKNLWLFNITSDPEERDDLSMSEKHSGLVREMLDFLLEVNSTAVPAFNPDTDPAADPRKHGGVWGPWQ